MVGCKDEPAELHVVAYDFGIKHNILRMLRAKAATSPWSRRKTSAEDVLALKPDGVFLSNGPGDPEPVTYAQRKHPPADGARRRSSASAWDTS